MRELNIILSYCQNGCPLSPLKNKPVGLSLYTLLMLAITVFTVCFTFHGARKIAAFIKIMVIEEVYFSQKHMLVQLTQLPKGSVKE